MVDEGRLSALVGGRGGLARVALPIGWLAAECVCLLVRAEVCI